MPKFEPGKSGNPGGRPKIARILAEMSTDATKLSKELFEKALEVMRAKRRDGNDANWRYAHEWLSNHVIGKPKQVVELTEGSGEDGLDFTKLTAEELQEMVDDGEALEVMTGAAGDEPRGDN